MLNGLGAVIFALASRRFRPSPVTCLDFLDFKQFAYLPSLEATAMARLGVIAISRPAAHSGSSDTETASRLLRPKSASCIELREDMPDCR